jgi:PD-(D/E)XK endonuclease
MKNRKNLGCRIRAAKERGAWAEPYFMALAASQGLKVSSPYGGFASYDVGVEDARPILRVQLKCTMCRHPKGGYSLNIRGPQ